MKTRGPSSLLSISPFNPPLQANILAQYICYMRSTYIIRDPYMCVRDAIDEETDNIYPFKTLAQWNAHDTQLSKKK